MSRIFYCRKCQTATLKKTCSKCDSDTINPVPPKFSKKDPYGSYRRIYKKQHTNKT